MAGVIGYGVTDKQIDDIKETGFYLNPQGSLPYGNYGILLCFKASVSVSIQIFITYPNETSVYIRRNWNGWSDWVEL